MNNKKYTPGDRFKEAELDGRTPAEKHETMLAFADSVERDVTYLAKLDEQSLMEKKALMVDVTIEKKKLEAKKRKFNKQINDEIKEVTSHQDDLVESVDKGYEERQGSLYNVSDYENDMVYTFDVDGVCVDSRHMRPSERQTAIPMNTDFDNTGTNG